MDLRGLLFAAFLAAALGGALGGASSQAADNGAISPEPFFRFAEYRELALSPSGKYIGALVPVQGHIRLAIIDLAAKSSRVIASVEDGDVTWFAWVNDERLVLAGGSTDLALDQARNIGLVALNADGTQLVRMTSTSPMAFHSVLRDGSDDVYMANFQFDRRFPNLSRVNTKTNRATLRTLEKPGDVVRWVIDRKGAIRAAVTDEKSLGGKVYWRADEDSPWVMLDEFKLGQAHVFPVAFDGDGSLIVAARPDRDTYALYRYDTGKKKLGEQLVAHPQVDLTSGLVFDRAKNRIVGIVYDGPVPGAAWFDEDWARIQKTVDASLPNHMNVLSRGGNRVLIYSYSDVDPGSWYLYDLGARRLEFIASARKWIKPETMPSRTPVRYTARDGLEIPGYLMLPKGREPKNLPLIVLVHGGPWVRGAHWAWSPEPAYLASLGYAVLEPEFRGSAGWGGRLQRAGWKQWGRAMQDDLNDGMDWLVREGRVDPKRACIMGASYGGYAVMMGLARDPKRWRCGINLVGVTDINLYFDISWADYAYSDWINFAAKDMIGDPDKDAAMLKASSPVERAAGIEAPVLMAYGLLDRRVPVAHGEKMRDALVANHATFEWITYPEEGHGLFLERSRFDFYGRVAAFLGKYNPPEP